MSIKSILFNTEMVQAILDGKKTVTRRLIKVPEDHMCYGSLRTDDATGNLVAGFWNEKTKSAEDAVYFKAPCKEGDILYVRETWCSGYDGEKYFYLADKCTKREEKQLINYDEVRWHPSIHMPKEAARIWFVVANVDVERLQDIDGYGILKEGLDSHAGRGDWMLEKTFNTCQREMFARLWDSTIKKSDLDKYSWDANPYV